MQGGGITPSIRMNSGGSINKMGEQYNPETGKYEAGDGPTNFYNPFMIGKETPDIRGRSIYS